jgi:hypothetical protein
MPLYEELNCVSCAVLYCWGFCSDARHLPQIYTCNNCPCIIYITVFYMYVLYFHKKHLWRLVSTFKLQRSDDGQLKFPKHNKLTTFYIFYNKMCTVDVAYCHHLVDNYNRLIPITEEKIIQLPRVIFWRRAEMCIWEHGSGQKKTLKSNNINYFNYKTFLLESHK